MKALQQRWHNITAKAKRKGKSGAGQDLDASLKEEKIHWSLVTNDSYEAEELIEQNMKDESTNTVDCKEPIVEYDSILQHQQHSNTVNVKWKNILKELIKQHGIYKNGDRNSLRMRQAWIKVCHMSIFYKSKSDFSIIIDEIFISDS